jgi:hypothetical protein
MANKKPKKRPESLNLRDFLGPELMQELTRERYPNFRRLETVLRNDPPSSVVYDSTLWDTVSEWSPIWLPRKLSAEGKVETYKRCLKFILLELNAEPPDGVLKPSRWKPGGPRESDPLHALWDSEGRPELTAEVCDRLARKSYPDEFARGDKKLKKALNENSTDRSF